jgi:nucleotide-binding universal stress UspA family protein
MVRVLLAVGPRDASSTISEYASELAGVLDLPLDVLTISETEEQAAGVWSAIEGATSGLGKQVTFTHVDGDVATAILERTASATVLVMGAYNHSRVYRLALGSVTEEVMRKSAGPVLLIGRRG